MSEIMRVCRKIVCLIAKRNRVSRFELNLELGFRGTILGILLPNFLCNLVFRGVAKSSLVAAQQTMGEPENLQSGL